MATAAVTSGSNKDDVHHALKGPHKPKVDNHNAVAEQLENLVEQSKSDHEVHVAISHLGGVTDAKTSTSRLDRVSNYLKSWGCNLVPNSQELDQDFVNWKMGNYVAVRGTDDKFFETMPLYVRIGMHLLFYSSKQHSLLRWGRVETLLQKMSQREGQIYDDASKPEDVQNFIKNFIATYNVDLSILEEPDVTKYKTRNEFFYRKLRADARPIADPSNKRLVSSAADCRLMVFNNAEQAKQIWIKGTTFSLKEMINKHGGTDNIMPEDSSLVIFRLAPADYHRYHHPIGPVKVGNQIHAGKEYYTVNPDAINEDFPVYTSNTRHVTMLDWTPIEGQKQPFKASFVSIGAMLVGSNVFTNAKTGETYSRGQEMGYFAYGGSTCIAVFPPEAKVKFDEDLIKNSSNGLETLVKANERLGISEA